MYGITTTDNRCPITISGVAQEGKGRKEERPYILDKEEKKK